MKHYAIILALICVGFLSCNKALNAGQVVAKTTASQEKKKTLIQVPARLFESGAGYFNQNIVSVSNYIIRHEQELENSGKLSGDGCSQTGEMALALGTSVYLATLKLGFFVCNACARILGAQPQASPSTTH